MKYEAVIGLEVHAELSTKSKIYCSCPAKFGAGINRNTCPVCTGMPGALPVLNRQVVHYAAKMGLATGCTINQVCKADRKNYFYPDLPKAYQISQFDVPLCENGEVYFYVDGEKKCCRLERIHFEEDAGKLLHEEIDGTVVDFNRCGVPLIEMVTRPDLRSSAEAKEFLETIKTTLSYLDICDCKMEEGSIRCDINVSIRPWGSTELGTRVEMKNVNTFSGAVRAIDYEIKRQIDLVEAGGTVQQETRRWDDVKMKNTVMRTKEDAQDYRYFPEPDILTVVIPESKVEEIRAGLPELPTDKLHRYIDELKINPATAKLLYKYKRVCDFAEKAFSLGAGVKNTVNLIVGTLYSKLETEEDKEKFALPVTAEEMANLVKLVDGGKINITLAQKTLSRMAEEGKPVSAYIKSEDLQGVDDGELTEICKKAVEANPNAVADFKGGKEKAIFALYGFIKKATQGKADIKKADEILRKLISD